MNQVPQPGIGELPSLRQLNRATLIALGAAAVILVTTVLPAEYGVDPTGIGRVLGLTEMGETKQADAASHAASAAPVAASPVPALKAGEPVEVKLTLAPNEGREVKATMKAGGEFDYRWATDGPEVRFELHGEPAGAASDDYTSYEKGSSAGASGKFRAPFDGTHGWYWKNRTGQPVTITVTATGDFEKFAALP
ncbi:hypothetical protein [Sphingobium sp. YC-XJ3]|jgi:hypothetical protein|uniref:hypothetical protein n=1 Tax=Sphingobium sp. YC-XJ3 TaxID=3024245 RepID=UPI00235F010A|nr:hypothetical protein [Sphingobium sp. YC-XJ3]WDA35032.1 hypothetical protein PO876_16370 [Sphingobium sp. YC-XJ3]